MVGVDTACVDGNSPSLPTRRNGITYAFFAYIGVESIVVTAAEAAYPRQDLPKASRRMYLWAIITYVVSVFLMTLNVNYKDPNLRTLSD
jgi:amino acid transporter